MSAGQIINCTDSDSDFDKGGVDNRRSQQNQPIDFSRILCFVSFNNLPQKIGGCASNTRAWFVVIHYFVFSVIFYCLISSQLLLSTQAGG